MKIRVVAIGGVKSSALDALASEYAKRIGRWATLVVEEIKEPTWAESDPARFERWTEETLLGRLKPKEVAVALDPGSPTLSSPQFAKEMGLRLDRGEALVFWIGGSLGLGALVKNAPWRLSVGPMTWPHGLFRVMLLEQIYRAFTIRAGQPYHK